MYIIILLFNRVFVLIFIVCLNRFVFDISKSPYLKFQSLKFDHRNAIFRFPSIHNVLATIIFVLCVREIVWTHQLHFTAQNENAFSIGSNFLETLTSYTSHDQFFFIKSTSIFFLLIVSSYFPVDRNQLLLSLLYTVISSIVTELVPQLGCLLAAIKLHFALLNGILHAPISYFDQTPIGRILSRFSKDLDVLDTTFPMLWGEILYCALEVIYNTHKHLYHYFWTMKILYFP